MFRSGYGGARPADTIAGVDEGLGLRFLVGKLRGPFKRHKKFRNEAPVEISLLAVERAPLHRDVACRYRPPLRSHMWPPQPYAYTVYMQNKIMHEYGVARFRILSAD